MPETTWRFRARAVVPLAAAAALSLTSCTGSGEGTDAAATSATPTPTPSIVQGMQLTQPGAQLRFGQFATAEHHAKGDRTSLLKLRVDSAQRGRLDDLAGFALDDPYKRRGNYYYVRVTVQNAGKTKLDSMPVPLWGISGRNTLLRPVDFNSSFKKCPTESLPQGLKPGAAFRTCLVYLSPDHGSLEGVGYRATENDTLIEWHGKIKQPPQSGGATKNGDKNGDKGQGGKGEQDDKQGGG